MPHHSIEASEKGSLLAEEIAPPSVWGRQKVLGAVGLSLFALAALLRIHRPERLNSASEGKTDFIQAQQYGQGVAAAQMAAQPAAQYGAGVAAAQMAAQPGEYYGAGVAAQMPPAPALYPTPDAAPAPTAYPTPGVAAIPAPAPAAYPTPDADLNAPAPAVTKPAVTQPSDTTPAPAVVDTKPAPGKSYCAAIGEEDCSVHHCCADEGYQCYEKIAGVTGGIKGWASCRKKCKSGPQEGDADTTPWSCKALGRKTQFENDVVVMCAQGGDDCRAAPCCGTGACFTKNLTWGECRTTCPAGWDCLSLYEAE